MDPRSERRQRQSILERPSSTTHFPSGDRDWLSSSYIHQHAFAKHLRNALGTTSHPSYSHSTHEAVVSFRDPYKAHAMVAASRGCLTCRRRKVRCDEARPVCLRCQRSGRECGGYRRPSELAPKSAALITKIADLPVRSRSGCITCKERKLKCDETWPVCQRCLTASRPCRRDIPASSNTRADLDRITFYTSSAANSSLSKALSPHPDTTWSEQRAVAFFHQRTAYHISGCNNSAHRWYEYLLAIGEAEPAIKHAVIALGSLHEEFESVSSPPYSTYTPLRTLPESHLAVQQYDKALSLIAIASPWQNKDTPLIACLLFAAFDSLRGRPEPALFHRCSGLRILAETSFSATSPLTELMHCVFLRFDTENLELGAPNFFESYGQPFTFPLITRPLTGFTTLKEACVSFEILFNRVLRAIKNPLQIRGPRSGVGPRPHLPDILLRYSEWCYAIDEYLRAAAMSVQIVDQDGVTDLVIVQLRRLLLRIILHVDINGSEMDFDRFTPEFAMMVALAECYANGCTRHPADQADGSIAVQEVLLPPAELKHETDYVHEKGPGMQCPQSRRRVVPEPSSFPPPVETDAIRTSYEYRPEIRFSGPRRQFLGLTASTTPVVAAHWPAIDEGTAVASAMNTLSRLPVASSASYSSTTSMESSPTETKSHPYSPYPDSLKAIDRAYAPSTFSLSPGIVCPLYVTATHCRDPIIRRRALRLLQATHRKEGQWDSLVCAVNAKHIIEAEEARAERLASQQRSRTTNVAVVGEITIPDGARIREVEAVMWDGPAGGDFERGVREGKRKRYEWRAVGGGGRGRDGARDREWSVVVPGCTTQ